MNISFHYLHLMMNQISFLFNTRNSSNSSFLCLTRPSKFRRTYLSQCIHQHITGSALRMFLFGFSSHSFNQFVKYVLKEYSDLVDVINRIMVKLRRSMPIETLHKISPLKQILNNFIRCLYTLTILWTYIKQRKFITKLGIIQISLLLPINWEKISI